MKTNLWKTIKNSGNRKKIEIDAQTLRFRLQKIMETNNIEIIHLALQSMIEEIEENRE